MIYKKKDRIQKGELLHIIFRNLQCETSVTIHV